MRSGKRRSPNHVSLRPPTAVRVAPLCRSNNTALTAPPLTLSCCTPASPHVTSEQRRDRAGTHSPPCSSLATSRRASGLWGGGGIGTPRPSTHDVLKRAWPCWANVEPCQATSRTIRGEGPAGRFVTAYCAPSQSVFFFPSVSYQVTPTTDLCVFLSLAVPNRNPAVGFIRTASVISVKCSA